LTERLGEYLAFVATKSLARLHAALARGTILALFGSDAAQLSPTTQRTAVVSGRKESVAFNTRERGPSGNNYKL
jgi:hypothetical protein